MRRTPFDEIKTLLLAALKSRNIDTLPNSNTLLPNPDNLEFGVLVDKKDLSKGWQPLVSTGRSIGNGKARKSGGRDAAIDDTPSGAGLGDGSWVAYRVKKTQSGAATNDEDTDGDSPDVDIDEDPGFDVVVPSYDDEVEDE
jgi:hypothetical protein